MAEKVILYSTGCPQCKVLKYMLDTAKITYETCSDLNTMKGLGITTVPMLSVDGDILSMKEAMAWVKEG